MSQKNPSKNNSEVEFKKALTTIDWVVVAELRHIPAGPDGSAQEQLRCEYAAYRTIHRQMTDKLRPRDALSQALLEVRRRWPDFNPEYDRAFFSSGAARVTVAIEDELILDVERMAANGGKSPWRSEVNAPVHDTSTEYTRSR